MTLLATQEAASAVPKLTLTASQAAASATPVSAFTATQQPPAAPPTPEPTKERSSPNTSPTLPLSPIPTQTLSSSVPIQTTESATPPPTPSPTAAAIPTPTTASAEFSQAPNSSSACEDKAAYYGDVTIPDDTVFRQGEKFVKTWQIKNAGTCTWGPDYSLIFAGGEIMNGPQTVPLPAVKPGDLFNVSVDLRAPSNGGTYLGDWEFQRPDGSRFGVNSGGIDMIWVKIVVSYVVLDSKPGATPGSPSGGSPGGTSGGSSGVSATTASCPGQINSDFVSQVLALINAARSSNNLKPLTLNPRLSAAAQVHSADMACNDFVDHTGSDGSTWYTRVKAQGYTYSYASENIYVGSPTFGGDAQGAFDWWMNSPVHRANILSPKVTEIGIGYLFYDKSTYGGYYTVDFARP